MLTTQKSADGFNADGFNADGFGGDGWDRDGYDRRGFDRDGFDADGFDADGFDRAGFDADGYDADGYNADGFDRDGYNADGYDENGYDDDGYNADGYDADGYDDDGYNADGYDRNGFNADGYDENGYDENGYDDDGYNADGYDRDGYNADGYDGYGRNRDGNTADDDGEYIGEYHSSSRKLGYLYSPKFDNEKPRVMLGLELELECDGVRRSELAETVIGRIGRTNDGSRYALCENDGSLDNGFEIVTAYTGLDMHEVMIKNLFSKPLRGAKSHDTSTCGLHVHVCKSNMTLYHAAKLVLFINAPENEKLIRAIARRDSTRFAEIKNKTENKQWLRSAMNRDDNSEKLRNLNSSRYEALNFYNPRTVEFRLFKGSLKYTTVMACLEFARLCWFFSRDTSANNLTTPAFIDYMDKPENKRNSRHLLTLLYGRLDGYALPKQLKNKPANLTAREAA